MAKERSGYVFQDKDSFWYARLTFTAENGKRRNVKRRAKNKTEAREILWKLRRDYADYGEKKIDGDLVTFNELAKIYEEQKLQEAQYKGERKISGRRSYLTPRAHVRTLVSHFHSRRIKGITHADVEKFRTLRLNTPINDEKERSIASVNRELEVLRAMFRFALRQGWIIRSPFDLGEPLISKADEVQRERVLSRDEEERLLLVCTGRRAHLRPLLIAALDTGMRRGELFQLKWSDVDLDRRMISVRATTTKTMRPRMIGMSERLVNELKSLWNASTQDYEASVFGITDTVKTAFASACKEAGIDGFRFHDCRHTAITRMIQAGVPPMQVMKISGHTQMTTFARYVNADDDAVRNTARAIDNFHAVAINDSLAFIN